MTRRDRGHSTTFHVERSRELCLAETRRADAQEVAPSSCGAATERCAVDAPLQAGEQGKHQRQCGRQPQPKLTGTDSTSRPARARRDVTEPPTRTLGELERGGNRAM